MPASTLPALIDTHQHLIHRDRCGYGWTEPITELAGRDFTLADYDDLPGADRVAGTIFMEAGVDEADYKAEARFMAARIGTHRLLGQIASCRPEEDSGFDAWLEECSDLGVVGFRRLLNGPSIDFALQDGFLENLRKIGHAGKTFDICVLQSGLPVALSIARACDGQQFILDHCGGPDRTPAAFDDWATSITALARLPHVAVKLSGIATDSQGRLATATFLRPWVDHILSAFGPDRVVWGSDWPLVTLGASFPGWLSLSETLLADLSGDEKARIAADNARAIYGV